MPDAGGQVSPGLEWPIAPDLPECSLLGPGQASSFSAFLLQQSWWELELLTLGTASRSLDSHRLPSLPAFPAHLAEEGVV